jgi:protein-disulfide isomerase
MRWAGALICGLFVLACSAPAAAQSSTATVPAAPTPTLPAPTPTVAPTATAVPVVQEQLTPTGDYFLGQPEAPITFEMFGDFQCPACGEFARTIEPPFKQQYIDTGKVKFVWHDYTWIGDESFYAAQAARCAGKQGHFWDYHDYLYAHQNGENIGQFSAANLEAFAVNIGLDAATFNACYVGAKDMGSIRDALQFGIGQGVDVTPTFLVNGDLKVGAPPMNRLAALMEYYLARTPH